MKIVRTDLNLSRINDSTETPELQRLSSLCKVGLSSKVVQLHKIVRLIAGVALNRSGFARSCSGLFGDDVIVCHVVKFCCYCSYCSHCFKQCNPELGSLGVYSGFNPEQPPGFNLTPDYKE